MSSNSRVLRSNSQTSPHKPISTANTISASNTITTLSTLTDLSTATCESMENGHNSQTPLPLDDEWAANLRRVVFVPSEAPAIAKNLDSRRHLNRSPAHIMLFPRTQEDALAMGIRMKYNNNARVPTAKHRLWIWTSILRLSQRNLWRGVRARKLPPTQLPPNISQRPTIDFERMRE
ncbi:hypothetical protein D9619_009179 [Psilocybe cf. subviscida]|uniref:Uncharacterized protein n=1 Tax=Psilocybe cf. subviscida TaxID=2480587 RepID=A0A8H5BV00_9AGAR|nr:hypothetical protein D9619_009179 [Psilocybe cf. subviscida]